MLLEATLVGEDLVAEVAALLLVAEQQPEEEAVDPAHEEWQIGAGGDRAERRSVCVCAYLCVCVSNYRVSAVG